MSQSQKLAERIKLARQLHLDVEQLEFLSGLSALEIRAFRADLTQALFEQSRPQFERAAAASVLLPSGMLADISQNIAGPMLSARIVGLLKPESALKVALKCSDAFMAEASIQLDPSRAERLIKAMPVERVSRIAALLVEREEYVTLARFVAYVDPHVIGQIISQIEDDEALLKAAFFIESGEVLNDLIHLLPEHRIASIARLAGTEGKDLWAEALALTEHMTPDWKGRIGDLVAAEGEGLLNSMLQSAYDLDLWDGVLPVVACMSDDSRAKLAGLSALSDPAVLRAVILAADEHSLWTVFLPLTNDMPAQTRAAAVAVVEDLPDEVLMRLLEVALRERLWPSLLGLVAEMSEEQKQRLGGLIARQSDEFLTHMLKDVRDLNLWAEILPLIGQMVGESQARLASLPALNSQAALSDLLGAAQREKLWGDVLPLISAMNESLRTTAAGLVSKLTPASLQEIIETVNQRGDWKDLIGLLSEMNPEERQRLLRLIADQPSEILNRLGGALQAGQGLVGLIKPTLQGLDANLQNRLGRLFGKGDSEN